MKYVLGFFFSEDRERVLLTKKNRPPKLAGKFTGLGGKVEPGERERWAMIREFREECGIDTYLPDWFLLGIQSWDNGDEMYVYYGFGDLSQAATTTDEPVYIADVHELGNYAMDSLSENLIYQVIEKFTERKTQDKIELQ